ncbi:MAG: hypothetical protein K0R50_839 [Eubacterium sp.]|nr:hypothetical protein [Eubacterium sp.]
MKKIISMLLVVTLLITFMTPVMASSSTSTDKGLENAIKAVKEKIEIPADCNKFTYNIYNQDGTVIWNLGWSNEEAQKYINVTIDENNFISSYSSYQYSSYYDKKIPKFSKEQGKETAEKFINKLNPKLLSEFKLVENNPNSQDREYNFNYVRQVNGISYNGNAISINVNNFTGQVTNYNCGYNKNVVFEDASKIISLEQAKKAFAEKLGLKLVYNVKSEKDKVVSYLAYIPKDANKYIDAITGNVEKTPTGFGINYTGSMMEKMSMATAADGASVVLTPDELDAVKGMSGLLTKEVLDTKLRAISQFKLDSEFTLASSELRKDWRNKDSLIWSLRYTKVTNKDTNQTREVSISVDAKSGDIIDFWTYFYSPEGAKPQKSKEEAKKISDEMLKDLFPSSYSKVKYDDTYYTYDEESQNQFAFRYVRVENGLEVPGDYITISYDNLSGNVTSVYTNWTKELKFDDPKKAISVDKATEILFDKIGYGIEYINDYVANNKIAVPTPAENVKVNAVLGYFVNNNKPCIISADTGEVLNYSGVVFKEDNVADYTDIKGLAAENQVKILTQLSIRYFENELKANEELLQKDYFILLSKLNDLYYFDASIDKETAVEKMYTNLISSGIITKAEKAPTAALTREAAAKYFVKFLRLSQVAEIKGIYKSDYKDADKISPDLLGYVCIATGFKAISDSKENFNPKSKISRLDGLLTIYNYLSNK